MLINKRIPLSFIFAKIKFEFIAITIFAFIVGFLDQNFVFITIPIEATVILGTTISLLLAFRTAQAYDRWWEARIIWGSIVNCSRSLIRELQTFINNESNTQDCFIKNFSSRQIAWCYCLGQSLRGENQNKTLEKYLQAEEIEKIKNHSNKANAILDLHSEAVQYIYKKNLINQFQQIQIMNTIAKLCDCMGMCERIKTTIFPRTYSNLLNLLIYIFAAMLPFSLTDYPPFVEEILSIVVSCAFFLIEKTAIYKQDPFEGRPTDTPVTAIARTIEINLLQMTHNEPVPAPLEAHDYYLM